MKLLNLRKEIKSKFAENNIEETDADFIISEILGLPRTELVLIDEVSEDQVKTINEKVEMRLKNVPIEKIFKKAYFYGYEFIVDDNVLSPRPESELLVENALKYIKENNYKSVLDMCTGSGCLAISVKKNADVDITAVDISAKALAIAKRNAKKLEAEVNFIKSNMFNEVQGKFDLIISNPPYIDSEEVKELDKEVIEHDPKIALDGGEFGLKFYSIIHENLRKYLNENGMLIIEIGEDQKELIVSLFNDFNLVEAIVDYSGNDRILIFKR